jgi:hypothetical protein
MEMRANEQPTGTLTCAVLVPSGTWVYGLTSECLDLSRLGAHQRVNWPELEGVYRRLRKPQEGRRDS